MVWIVISLFRARVRGTLKLRPQTHKRPFLTPSHVGRLENSPNCLGEGSLATARTRLKLCFQSARAISAAARDEKGRELIVLQSVLN